MQKITQTLAMVKEYGIRKRTNVSANNFMMVRIVRLLFVKMAVLSTIFRETVNQFVFAPMALAEIFVRKVSLID